MAEIVYIKAPPGHKEKKRKFRERSFFFSKSSRLFVHLDSDGLVEAIDKLRGFTGAVAQSELDQ